MFKARVYTKFHSMPEEQKYTNIQHLHHWMMCWKAWVLYIHFFVLFHFYVVNVVERSD